MAVLKDRADVIAVDARAHRRRRWLRRFLVGLAVIVMFVAFGGWLRGQDQWGPFRGQIVDVETGAPIPNANVMVSWRIRRFNLADTISDFYDARETVADSQGRFELPRLWRLWTWNVMEPGVGYFAPGYVAMVEEVSPQDGVPFVDPTVVKMRQLEVPAERCRPENYVGSPLHDKAPLFREAVEKYRSSLSC